MQISRKLKTLRLNEKKPCCKLQARFFKYINKEKKTYLTIAFAVWCFPVVSFNWMM